MSSKNPTTAAYDVAVNMFLPGEDGSQPENNSSAADDDQARPPKRAKTKGPRKKKGDKAAEKPVEAALPAEGASEDAAPATEENVKNRRLLVTEAVRDRINNTHNLRMNSEFMDRLQTEVLTIIDTCASRAISNGRRTVKSNDF